MKNWSLKNLFIGRARDLSDRGLFHKISLIAVLAWVGLGADGHSIFVQVGALDAGSFKGAEELERLKADTSASVRRYVEFAQRHGFVAESVTDVGHDIVGKIADLSEDLLKQHPNAVLFGGQLAFRDETRWTRWLHNYAVFALQQLFCRRGVPLVIVPARV